MLQIINSATGLIPMFSSPGYGGCALTGSWIGWILWVLIIVLVISLVHSLFKKNTDKTNKEEDNALKTLRNEYAKGNISKEEYEQKKKVLEDG